MWKIENIISKGDYNYAVVYGHPYATKDDYVLEHRIVMENHLGRILTPEEVVHHIDGNKKNNVIENLELMDRLDHIFLHRRGYGHQMVKLKCPNCGKIFDVERRQSYLSKHTKFTCCSRHCRGSIHRQIQLRGLTPELDRAISENLIYSYREYIDNSEETN